MDTLKELLKDLSTDLKCNMCNKSISSFYTVNNKNYCYDCYEKYIVERCHHCNKKLGTHYTVNNKKYCTDCYFKYKVPRCNVCNRPLIEGYRYNKNGKYCYDCYEKYIVERCHHCNKILATHYTVNNKKYCADCYIKYKVPRCNVCNKPLIDGYLYNKTGKYCYNCDKKYPHCWECNLPIKYPGFKDDDFILCQQCSKYKITKIEDLKKLYYKVKLYAQKSCGINAPIKKAVLLSSTELKQRNNKSNYTNRAIGFCRQKYTGFTSEKSVIYVQNGMTYNMMFGTLAHEYGHAWEHQNKNRLIINQPQDAVFSEGFAEWVKYNTIKEYGLKEEAERMIKNAKENWDPVYGTGFKKMMKLEKKLGSKQAVLEYVKNNNTF